MDMYEVFSNKIEKVKSKNLSPIKTMTKEEIGWFRYNLVKYYRSSPEAGQNILALWGDVGDGPGRKGFLQYFHPAFGNMLLSVTRCMMYENQRNLQFEKGQLYEVIPQVVEEHQEFCYFIPEFGTTMNDIVTYSLTEENKWRRSLAKNTSRGKYRNAKIILMDYPFMFLEKTMMQQDICITPFFTRTKWCTLQDGLKS